MSRIGRKPIKIPSEVKIEIGRGEVGVKGPKGELSQKIHSHVKIKKEGDQLIISVKNPNNRDNRALWGLSRALIANMIKGVTKGFEKKLEIKGVGYKASLQGKKLILNIGFSHPVEFRLPEAIEAKIDKNIITISGLDKQLVGEIAAQIRAMRKPEPYKGKGIKYVDEVIKRKVGKVVKTAEGAK